MKTLLCGAVLSLALVAGGHSADEKKAEPKEIAKIMKEAHGGGKDSLRAKVVAAMGTEAEAKKLLGLYEDLGKNKPPMGELADWKKKTTTILAAAKKVAAKPDDEDAAKALGAATNCKACHDAHKKPEEK